MVLSKSKWRICKSCGRLVRYYGFRLFKRFVALWDELIEILKYWAKLGVDGYRCDVASFVPVDFWIRARHEISEINPDFIWLAESVDGGFIQGIRTHGYDVSSDGELYQAFDICYDYDVYALF